MSHGSRSRRFLRRPRLHLTVLHRVLGILIRTSSFLHLLHHTLRSSLFRLFQLIDISALVAVPMHQQSEHEEAKSQRCQSLWSSVQLSSLNEQASRKERKKESTIWTDTIATHAFPLASASPLTTLGAVRGDSQSFEANTRRLQFSSSRQILSPFLNCLQLLPFSNSVSLGILTAMPDTGTDGDDSENHWKTHLI